MNLSDVFHQTDKTAAFPRINYTSTCSELGDKFCYKIQNGISLIDNVSKQLAVPQSQKIRNRFTIVLQTTEVRNILKLRSVSLKKFVPPMYSSQTTQSEKYIIIS